MRKVCALFLVVMLLFTLVCPTQASEITVDILQENIDTMSELIQLIRHAEDSGDEKSAEYFRILLNDIGVECLTYDEVIEMAASEGLPFGAEAYTINSDLPGVPELVERDSLDWYTYNSAGYYYPERADNYDVYVIMASPRNSGSYLRKSGTIQKNDEEKIFWSNIQNYLYSSVLDFGAEAIKTVTGYKTIITVLDLLANAFSGVEPYSVESVKVGYWTVTYTMDTTISYIYVRESDTLDDYTLAMYGNQIELKSSYSQLVEAFLGDGATEEDIIAITDSDVISAPTYNNYKTAIDYFRSGMVADNYLETVQIIMFEDMPELRKEIDIDVPNFAYPWGVYSVPGDKEVCS